MDHYQTLGINANADEREIKRAYAKRIKEYRPDSHPVEFVRIREAYESVLQQLKWRQHWQEQQPEMFADNTAPETASLTVDENANPSSSNSAEQTDLALVAAHIKLDVPTKSAELTNPIELLVAAYDNGGEAAALQMYQTVVSAHASQALDIQMHLEDHLLEHFLYGTTQSLQVFNAAEQRYGWLGNQMYIARQYGDWAGRKLEDLHQLCYLSHQVLADGATQESQEFWSGAYCFAKRVRTQKNSKAARAEWASLCDAWEFEHLKKMVASAEPLGVKLTWADACITLLITAAVMIAVGNASLQNNVNIIFWHQHYKWRGSLYVARFFRLCGKRDRAANPVW